MAKKGQMGRLGELAARVVTDVGTPGVGPLFQALVEERTRRFVAQLTSACLNSRDEAERKIRELSNTSEGEKLLMHVARECFLGTERLSLAAIAVLVSEYETLDPGYREMAGRSFEGLADLDAWTFLLLLSREKSSHKISSEWLPAFVTDVKALRSDEWAVEKKILGFSEETFFSGLTECLRRRLLMPDSKSGRLGGVDDVAKFFFSISQATMWSYKTLYRAAEIVDQSLLKELNVRSPESVSAHWWPGTP